MSDRWLASLTRQGWSPDRRVDVSAWEAACCRQGFAVVAPAREFAARFFGLRLRQGEYLLEFDLEAIEELELEVVESIFEGLLDEPLTPVGVMDARHFDLFITERGWMIAAMETLVLHLGNSWQEGFAHLLDGGPMPTLEMVLGKPPRW